MLVNKHFNKIALPLIFKCHYLLYFWIANINLSPLQVVRGPKMPSTLDCKVYVGDLGSGASKQELEEAFSYYGPLRNVWVARNPPGFAFVEFEDMRDAEDAVRGLDGR